MTATTTSTSFQQFDPVTGLPLGASVTLSRAVLDAGDLNPTDGLVYAFNSYAGAGPTLPSNSIVAVEKTGSTVSGAATAAKPLSGARAAGAFGPDGALYLMSSAGSYNVVNFSGGPIGTTPVGSSLITGGIVHNVNGKPGSQGYGFVGDWTYIAGSLWGVATATESGKAPGMFQYTIGLSSYSHSIVEEPRGAITAYDENGAPIALTSANPFQGVYTDGTYLYAVQNGTGAIFRFDVANDPTTAIRIVPSSSLTKATDIVSCTGPVPTVQVVKEVGARYDPADQFTVSLSADMSGLTLPSATTTDASPDRAATPPWPTKKTVAYTVLDTLTPGSATDDLELYHRELRCENNGVPLDPQPVEQPGKAGAWDVPITSDTDNLVCAISNRAPSIEVAKVFNGRYDDSDDARVRLVGGPVDAEAETYGDATTSTGAVAVPLGGSYRLEEELTAGSPSDLDRYTVAIACDNNGSEFIPAPIPGELAAWTVTPDDVSDLIRCEIANTPIPTISASKSVTGRVMAGDQFTLTLSGADGELESATTTGSDTSLATAFHDAQVGATYTIADALTVGSPSKFSYYDASISCENRGQPGPTPTEVAAGVWTVAVTAATDRISCEVVNHGTPTPELSITAAADPTTVAAVGDEVEYTFTVANTGNVPITDVDVAASFSTLGATGTFPLLDCDDEPVGGLPPEGALTCAATYRVSQRDIDLGALVASAKALGSDPTGGAVFSDDASVPVTADWAPGLSASAVVDPATVDRAGTEVVYTVTLTNTGNVSLDYLEIASAAFTTPGATGAPRAVDCDEPEGGVPPTGELVCRFAYEISQADVDRGTLAATFSAVAADPAGGAVSADKATAKITAVHRPELAASASTGSAVVSAVGDHVVFTVTIANTGNVTMRSIAAAGTFATTDAVGVYPALICPEDAIGPGESVTCRAIYTVNQRDIDLGAVAAAIQVSGDAPTGGETTARSTATFASERTPRLAITATAAPASAARGDAVSYLFEVTNAGNTTMRDLAVAGAFDSPAAEAFAGTQCDPITELAPGASVTCRAAHTVDQAAVDNAGATLAVTATGVSLYGGPAATSDAARASFACAQHPHITIAATVAPVGFAAAGDLLNYLFVIVNTGDVTLTEAALASALPGAICPTEPASRTLAPGGALLCAGTHRVTLDDLDAGVIRVDASATATAPDGSTVSSRTATVIAGVESGPRARLEIGLAASPSRVNATGQEVEVTLRAVNTGDLSLRDVRLSDAGAVSTQSTGALVFECDPAQGATLRPGEYMTCSARYVVRAADLLASSLSFYATVNGETLTGLATATATAATEIAVVPPVDPDDPAQLDPSPSPAASPKPSGETTALPTAAPGLPARRLPVTGADIGGSVLAVAALAIGGLTAYSIARRRAARGL